jgi:Fe-Mn family superoxide dismutase
MMPYAIKPLGCDPAKVNGMSERLIISHYENNYCGAVRRLNMIEQRLAELDCESAAGFLINGLKREELIAMNSMILHELFFDGLVAMGGCPPGAMKPSLIPQGFSTSSFWVGDESEPGIPLKNAIGRDFGSYERWRSEFVAMGKALGGGSGWVLLSWSPRDRKLVNQWASDHCHTLAGATPILALDMYEHSYHIDFGAKAGSYVEAFMGAVRWGNVDRLLGELTADVRG